MTNPGEARAPRWRVAAVTVMNFILGVGFLFVAFLGLDVILNDGFIKTTIQWLLAGFSMVLFGSIPRPLIRRR